MIAICGAGGLRVYLFYTAPVRFRVPNKRRPRGGTRERSSSEVVEWLGSAGDLFGGWNRISALGNECAAANCKPQATKPFQSYLCKSAVRGSCQSADVGVFGSGQWLVCVGSLQCSVPLLFCTRCTLQLVCHPFTLTALLIVLADSAVATGSSRPNCALSITAIRFVLADSLMHSTHTPHSPPLPLPYHPEYHCIHLAATAIHRFATTPDTSPSL